MKVAIAAPAYGSENAEQEDGLLPTRRIPEESTSSRKQTKSRLAVAGATLGFIATLALVGYSACLPSPARDGDAPSIPTQQLVVSAQKSSQFVSPPSESLYPTLEQLDVNPKDGVVTKKEYLKYLEAKKDADIAEVNTTTLPEDVKASLVSTLEANFDSDGPCAVRAMKRIKANGITLTKENIKVLYHTLDIFCPTPAIESLSKLIAQYAISHIVVDTPIGSTVSLEIPTTTALKGSDSGSGYDSVSINTVVVDTPSGPSAIVIPVVRDGEPSTTVVVDTPTGPTVIEVPLKPAEDIGTQDGTKAPALGTDDAALQLQFQQRVTEFFEDQTSSLRAATAQAESEEGKIAANNKALDDCIEQAANKFGWYGVYEEPQYSESAIDWVLNVCLVADH